MSCFFGHNYGKPVHKDLVNYELPGHPIIGVVQTRVCKDCGDVLATDIFHTSVAAIKEASK